MCSMLWITQLNRNGKTWKKATHAARVSPINQHTYACTKHLCRCQMGCGLHNKMLGFACTTMQNHDLVFFCRFPYLRNNEYAARISIALFACSASVGNMFLGNWVGGCSRRRVVRWPPSMPTSGSRARRCMKYECNRGVWMSSLAFKDKCERRQSIYRFVKRLIDDDGDCSNFFEYIL